MGRSFCLFEKLLKNQATAGMGTWSGDYPYRRVKNKNEDTGNNHSYVLQSPSLKTDDRHTMTNIKKISSLLIALLLCACVTGCAQNVSPNTYSVAEVGVASKVVSGVIIDKRAVNIDANSGAGGLAGVVGGAAAGSTLGSGHANNVVGAVGGAVIGGLAGNAIDKAVNHHPGFEYIIQLKQGGTIAVVQAEETQFAVNQHVLLIYGAMTRIIPDNTHSRST
jgi:outer membrane lipoprotein SlyB